MKGEGWRVKGGVVKTVFCIAKTLITPPSTLHPPHLEK